MTYRSAERVETKERRQYHLGAAPGEVADLVLLLGDPERAQKVAARFSALRFSCQNRDYHVYTGTHRGRELSVICVGSPMPKRRLGAIPASLLYMTSRVE